MAHPLRRVFAVAGTLTALAPFTLLAQQATTISGRVLSDAQTPLPSVSVSIPQLSAGALTNADGRYSFTVPANRVTGQTVTITARRIGFEPKSAQVRLNGSGITQDFTLVPAPTQLTGIVVTALGQEKEKSQLGTAQQQLSTTELNQTFAPNVESQLSGKVSGVNIIGNGTQGGTTNITIRGYTSITGNNQPLFIVDGIPVSNSDRGSNQSGGGMVGSKDFGNAIQDINPDDIASLTVLKGPNAAALYGSRAANGAIIITTKRGGVKQSTMDVSTSLTFDTPSRLPDFQNEYGQGSAGFFKWVNGLGPVDGNDQSYGPKLDGRLIDQFTGKQQPWVAHPDNVSSFFNTGKTADATVGISGGTEHANARLSISGENVEGIIPNEYLRRIGGLASGTLQAGDHLTLDGSVNYIRDGGVNRPGQGYVGGIMEGLFVWFGRQVDMNALKSQWQQSGSANGGPTNREYNWNYSYHNNPYFMQYGNPESDTRNRVIVNGSATYRFTDWLNAMLRSGTDTYGYNINTEYAEGNIELNNGSNTVNPSYNGAFTNLTDNYTETNTDLLLTAHHDAGSHFALSGTVGGTTRYVSSGTNSVAVNGIIVPGIYNVANAGLTPTNGQSVSNLQVNSFYGDLSETFNGWWTIEATARNDWSSTLPAQSNSYFYPSINTSIVLSDAIPALRRDWLSYLKIRGGTARVGNDAAPYQLFTPFNGNANRFNGQPLFTLSNTLLNPNLKPEQTVGNEGGVELGLFNNRVSLDASIYDKYTTNEITQAALPPSSGFGSQLVNAGKVDNKGYEALLTIEPVRTGRWDWTSTFNFSHNVGRVVTLSPGLTYIPLSGLWQGAVQTQARVGQPFGELWGYGIKRNDQGVPLLDDNGLWQPTDTLIDLGSTQPKWIGGWVNTVRFKNFSLGSTLDIHHGGKIFSGTNFYGSATGTLAFTLKGREVDWNNPGNVINGIIESTGQQNTNNVTTEQYWQYLAYNNIAEPYVYDASYVRLRELRVGWDLPASLANRMNASSVNIALVGRNLWLNTKVPNIDPEFTYTTGNNQGIEYATLPVPKSIGFSVRLTP